MLIRDGELFCLFDLKGRIVFLYYGFCKMVIGFILFLEERFWSRVLFFIFFLLVK